MDPKSQQYESLLAAIVVAVQHYNDIIINPKLGNDATSPQL